MIILNSNPFFPGLAWCPAALSYQISWQYPTSCCWWDLILQGHWIQQWRTLHVASVATLTALDAWGSTLGSRDRGPKSYPWLRKMGQNQTLDSKKCHKIKHFWSTFAWNWWNLAHTLSFASKENGEIRSKWPKLAENIPLAMEHQPKLDPWLRKSSQK